MLYHRRLYNMGLLEALQLNKPLTKTNLASPLVSEHQSKRLFATSFVDLLPVKNYLGDGVFSFRAGGLGSVLKIKTLSLEATTKDYQNEALEAITFVLKNGICYEHVDFWLSQMFIIKQQSADNLLSKIQAHCNNSPANDNRDNSPKSNKIDNSSKSNKIDNSIKINHGNNNNNDTHNNNDKHNNHNQFTNNYLNAMDKHIRSLSNTQGAFIDKNTGHPWSLAEIEVYFCLWQQKSPNTKDLKKEFELITDAITTVQHGLTQANIKTKRIDDKGYIEMLRCFFNTDDDNDNNNDINNDINNDNDNDTNNINVNDTNNVNNNNHNNNNNQTINSKPNILNTLDQDLSQIALNQPKIDVQEHGIFKFQRTDKTRYAAYMPLECINNTELIDVGHLSAESQKTKLSIFDRLPIGSIWSQTTIYISNDKADEYLAQIKNSSMGNDAKSKANSDAAQAAMLAAAKGDYITRYAAGLYLFNNEKTQLKAQLRKVRSIFSALGLDLLETRANPLSQDDFIRSLPFCFNYQLDRAFYKRRSSLQHISTIAALSPFYGRSTGTGTPGVIKFNRGGEALMFDPVVDKSQNAFGLLFGPSGTGKSAWLIEFLFAMMAVHKPKHVFIIEKGDSFGLFVDHCKRQGLSTNKVAIKTSCKDLHLPPFANATRLITDKNIDQERDLLGELSIVAQLMITGGETKEADKFERSDWDTLGNAIQQAAKRTLAAGRTTTLTQDVIAALNQLADDSSLLGSEQQRIRKMAKSMRVYINSAFDRQIFNSSGSLFPESDVTQLDVGIFGSDGYESKLVVAFASLINDINRIAEQNQYNTRPIFLLIDEAHLFTKQPLIISWILKMVKMWRKWGVWVWFATPSIEDYADTASSMFDTIEWIICLKIKKSEALKLAKLIDITSEQKQLIASISSSKGQYKEGVVISDQLSTLFRSVSMPLALALAMTEQSEKAQRQKIMQDSNCSEMQAAYQIADEILQARIAT